MMDITNHYVVQGVSGGVLKLVLFLAIIVASFKTVGRWFKGEDRSSPAAILVWATGVSLFAHCLSFVSATYFDQIVVIWYWLLAVIAAIPMWAVQESDKNLMSQAGEGVNSLPIISTTMSEENCTAGRQCCLAQRQLKRISPAGQTWTLYYS